MILCSHKRHIDGFEKYWRRRKPGTSTAVHYTSDVRIFFKWAIDLSPETITVHDVDHFIEWQQSLGRAPATIQRRLIALRMFYDYLAYTCDQEVPNPIVPRRHYISRGHQLPRSISQNELELLFAAVDDHLRDRTIFTLMLHAGLRIGEVINLRLGDVYLSQLWYGGLHRPVQSSEREIYEEEEIHLLTPTGQALFLDPGR